MNTTNSQHRQAITDALQGTHFDLLVVGGGITGAGIALDAATRGMRVALVERRDFASGTSSKSTKLIHGGLRYLKNFEFLLVREVGRERAVVHRLAPHLVVPEKMLLPILENGSLGRWSTSVGLWVYDVLAGVRGADRRKMLSRAATLAQEPLLDRPDLLGAGLYAEYRTDDARLTIEVLKTAIRHGAVCLNHCPVETFLYEQGRVAGATCRNAIDNTTFHVRARQVVNAAGPWVDELREKDHSRTGKHLFLSKGVHVVIAHERLPLRHSVYFDVPDGRMMFAIPRHRCTYLGTTDTPYDGHPDEVAAKPEDVAYILDAANNMFTTAGLTAADVESTWAGLRPLIFEEGKGPGEMSRKDEIFQSPSGLLSIAGGKLTGYRLMAKKVVDVVARRLGIDTPSKTHELPLTPKPFEDVGQVAAFEAKLRQKVERAGLPGWQAAALTESYGADAERVIEEALAAGGGQEGLVKAELHHAVKHELAATTLDFYERRSGRLFFEIQSIEPTLEMVLAEMGRMLHWDRSRTTSERQAVHEALRRARCQ
ncbi:MAG: aerobic glycerol-3-phosphate dehydrogenase [Saprospiraceae bacterium]|nr:MAG: aerobic glycerol-3-phosphate dehydrogenase [Saprospiraceae bacterium]